MLSVNDAVHHEYVTGAEVLLLLFIIGSDGNLCVEVVRDGGAFHQLEAGGIVEQCAVYAAAVRSFLVHNLVVGIGNGRLFHQVFQHVAVLHLGQAQHRVPHPVVLVHIRNHAGHVLQLDGILVRRPLVGSVGQVLVVVLALVVHGVKQVFQVVEAYDVTAAVFLLGAALYGHQQHQRCQQEDITSHTISNSRRVCPWGFRP